MIPRTPIFYAVRTKPVPSPSVLETLIYALHPARHVLPGAPSSQTPPPRHYPHLAQEPIFGVGSRFPLSSLAWGSTLKGGKYAPSANLGAEARVLPSHSCSFRLFSSRASPHGALTRRILFSHLSSIGLFRPPFPAPLHHSRYRLGSNHAIPPTSIAIELVPTRAPFGALRRVLGSIAPMQC